MFDFRVLGALEVSRDGIPLPLPSRRQRALIARLVLSRGQVVPAGALVNALWEIDPPPGAWHALHTYVSRVRGLLGSAVVTRAPGYLLAVPPESVDAERFEAGVAQAAELATQRPGAAVELLDQLLGWWRGPAYAEFAAGFAQPAAVRLDELRLLAQEELATGLLATGAVDRAVTGLGELVADHPLRERPYGLLMQGLAKAGRLAEALGAYHRLRQRLGDELGLDPSPALQQLHTQLLRHEPTPPVGPATTPPAPPSAPGPGPPLRAPTLPPLTSLVGRGDALRRLAELVEDGRLVTLVGPGGVGKTRLARELVARWQASEQPVWWVDLVPAREPPDVQYRLLDALGLPEPADAGIEEFLVEALRPARGLLVADNCEHVAGTSAPILAQIAARCPGVAVLATSRERLAVAGEQVLALPPLPDPDHAAGRQLRDSPAVQLFADRLRATGAPELAPAELPLVAEVCRRVDGLPLAIELAAARAGSLGVAAVAERPMLDLLAGGHRTDPARHRSLRAALDWSHDLLAPPERILFRRLAVFGGAFSLDEAEAVCADARLPARQLATQLAGLVDKSMLARPAHGQYRLLGAMRAYAVEQLAAHGEDLRLSAAHARYFGEFAEQARAGLQSAQEPYWIGRLADRLDALRTAHRWACLNNPDLAVRLAVALAPYARYQMRFELQDWAETAALLPAAARHPLRAAALGSAAAGAWARGDFARAQRLARRGLAAVPAGHTSAGAAGPMLVIGDVALLEGRFADADRAYAEAARVVDDDDPGIACEAWGGRAIAHSYLADPAGAGRFADAGLRLAEERNAPGLIALAQYFAGESLLPHDPAAALALLDQARSVATEVGALFVVGLATLSAVSIRARAETDPAAALVAYRDAVEHWRRVGNRTQQWVTLRNLVPVLVRAGHPEQACLLHGAVAAAPVRLPDELPEATSLAEALAAAQRRLGTAAAAATGARGARLGMDELVTAVLATIDATAPRPVPPAATQIGSSR